jgi:hypothetical protein
MPLFKKLFGTNSGAAVAFRSNIRGFNSALAYTSIGCRHDPTSTGHFQGPLAGHL